MACDEPHCPIHGSPDCDGWVAGGCPLERTGPTIYDPAIMVANKRQSNFDARFHSFEVEVKWAMADDRGRRDLYRALGNRTPWDLPKDWRGTLPG